MFDVIDNYVDLVKNTPEFIELLELKKSIDKNYRKEIVSFKTKEAMYLEAKERSEYYSNIDELQKSFVEAKSRLYSHPEVKRYFELERIIQEMLDSDMNELKCSISNKFSEVNRIKL